MRLRICAIGRLRAGPERDVLDDYLSRCEKTGRGLGLGPCQVHEVDDRKGGKGGGPVVEAGLLAKAVPQGAVLVALDERGQVITSPDFAKRLAEWRDAGRRDACFVIGGADGLQPDLLRSADLVLSFGKMVWPHMLVRIMLAEQLYRATTILAGTPYHRA